MLDTLSKRDSVLRKARGGDAPYQICNRTGVSVHVWSDVGGPGNTNPPSMKISTGDTIDWRFDDWKTMREVCYCKNHELLSLIISPT
jgi:vacuolar protein sorting-associated protein 13A/C